MLLFALPYLTTWALLAAAPMPAAAPAARFATDTTVTPSDTAQPLLTVDGLKRMTAFAALYFKHPSSVLDSAQNYRTQVPLPAVTVKGAPAIPMRAMATIDMAAFARQNATVAGDFKAARLTPEEYDAWRRALVIAQAIYRADYLLNGDAGALDTTTPAGKNALFFKRHPEEISALRAAGVRLRPSLRAQDVLTPAKPDSASSLFAPITLPPTPSATRLATGAPGPKYWQNRADYDLKATLDTTTQTVRGSMTLRYTNNSPNTLKVLWFQTEQDPEVIDRFDQVVGGKAVPLAQQHPGADVYEMQVTLAEPLKPGRTATFRAEWHFQIPDGGGLRMGRDKALYAVAQWYPRPNVYDDVKGWNTESYETNAEFYLEYGDYTLEVTLPAGYIVAATGTLDNPKDVLTPTQIARLAQAAKADTVVRVITQAELQNGTARPTTQGMLTWKFHAKNVRDAAWVASPDYQWDVAQWHGILAQAYYRPKTASIWADAADQARMSIQEYSERWFLYPYPQISAVECPVPGMEYPMLAMEANTANLPSLYEVVTHEIGHNWFPMIVGSNERMHAWMDEGFNTFINTFSEARRYPAEGDQAARVGKLVFNGNQSVIETGNPTGNGDAAQYFGTSQRLQLLRRAVLGEQVFDKAFRTYIARWAFKHPTPMDFFRTMENVSGQKLDWFWRENFFDAPRFDQAVDSVGQTAEGAKTRVTVRYANKDHAVFPLLVRFTFADGTTRDVTHPADVWRANPATYTTSYTFDKKVSGIILDPNNYLPDAERSNNSWTAP